MDRILDLPQNVRVAIFAVIVAIVAVIGYQVMYGDDASEKPAKPDTTTSLEDDGSTVITNDDEDLDTQPTSPSETADPDAPATTAKIDVSSPVTQAKLNAAAQTLVTFSEKFVSYRYDQSIKAKEDLLDAYLAKENTLDLAATFPSEAAEESLKNEKMVIKAKVAEVRSVMVSDNSLAFELDLNVTTITRESTETSESNFEATMSYSPSKQDWLVESFDAQGGPFLDESLG